MTSCGFMESFRPSLQVKAKLIATWIELYNAHTWEWYWPSTLSLGQNANKCISQNVKLFHQYFVHWLYKIQICVSVRGNLWEIASVHLYRYTCSTLELFQPKRLETVDLISNKSKDCCTSYIERFQKAHEVIRDLSLSVIFQRCLFPTSRWQDTS